MMTHRFDFYQDDGRWFFDDPARGIVREEMVLGADTALSALAGAGDHLTAIVSDQFIAGSDLTLLLAPDINGSTAEGYGTWYREETSRQPVWLCPTLFRYFSPAPEHLYVKVVAP